MNHVLRRFYSYRQSPIPYASEIKKFLDDRRRRTISVQEWCDFRAELLQNERNQLRVDSDILRLLSKDTLKHVAPNFTTQYLRAMAELNVQPTLANYSSLITSYRRKAILTPAEQSEVVDTCNTIVAKSGMCLPRELMHTVIAGFCLTDQWKQSLSLLQNSEVVGATIRTVVVEKAFDAGDIDVGFRVLDEILALGSEIRKTTFTKYWNYCQRQPAAHFVQNVERMLNYLESSETVMPESCVHELHGKVKRFGGSCHLTEISETSGLCNTCENRLDGATVSTEDFERLRNAVMDIALIGDNVYFTTTPDELRSFKSLIEGTAPYDVVVDGLNVAFMNLVPTNNMQKASRLASLVRHFANQNKRILVVGRKHMSIWPRQQMDYIRSNAAFFSVGNESKDDIFTLYAALYSGPQTRLVTNDWMRAHSIVLGYELETVFKRWQMLNRMKLILSPKIEFEPPPLFTVRCHKVNGHWHIPYVRDEEFRDLRKEMVQRENVRWSCVRLSE